MFLVTRGQILWSEFEFTPNECVKMRYTSYRKRKFNQLENVAIANALQLEAARRRAVPNGFNFVVHANLKSLAYRLPSYSVFTVHMLHYAVTLTFDPVILNLHSVSPLTS